MTAELALALPAVVLCLALLVAVGRVTLAQVRCADGARAGARLAARGESVPRVTAAVRAAVPAGASVSVTSRAGTVEVQVAARVPVPLPGGPSLDVSARAVALAEEP